MKPGIEDVDQGWSAFMGRMGKLAREQGGVKVGVFDGEQARIAAIHEFGAPAAGIPERSFLRSTCDRNREKYVDLEKELLERALQGKLDVDKALGILGAKAVADCQETIRAQTGFVPLAPATIAARERAGFEGTKALIRTGELLNSITWQYEEKGGGQ